MFVIAVLTISNAHAYFFSATDGPDLYAFKAVSGSNGSLNVVSQFKWAAPGTVGATAILAAPGTTDTRKLFDVFATFTLNGKAALVRDRIELDETTGTWTKLSRKILRTHKLDNYNIISGSAEDDLSGARAAGLRFLTTKNGTDVNIRKVSSSGSLTGKNKPLFNNPSNFQVLSAAQSSQGDYAIESFFASAAPASTDARLTSGLAIFDAIHKAFVAYSLAEILYSVSVGESDDKLCIAYVGAVLDNNAKSPFDLAAVDKTGVGFVTVEKDGFEPGKVVKISKTKVTTLARYLIFNTAFLLPDAKGIVFGRQVGDKLEYKIQPLNGSCGPKLGGAKPFLTANNPIIASNNPIYGWAAAACAAGLLPNIC